MYKYMYQADTKGSKMGIIKDKIYYLAYGSGYISKKNYMATYLWFFLLYGSQFPPWNTSN